MQLYNKGVTGAKVDRAKVTIFAITIYVAIAILATDYPTY